MAGVREGDGGNLTEQHTKMLKRSCPLPLCTHAACVS
jgi:hypothetical protein